MKLETKHVLLYLGYELRVEILDYKSNYVGRRYDEIIGIHQWSINKDWCLLTDGGSKPSLNSVKLILRPLSEFVDGNFSDEVQEYLNGYSIDYVLNHTNRLAQFVIDAFAKDHLDIFNLIPNGLAISIHDTKQ